MCDVGKSESGVSPDGDWVVRSEFDRSCELPPHRATCLVVGVGSTHGDDRLGWEVARILAAKPDLSVIVRSAQTPLDLLNWLEGVTDLQVVDACISKGTPGSVRQLKFPNDQLDDFRWAGTHDFDLKATLELAEAVGQLPASVTIWAVQGASFAAQLPPSPQINHWAENVALMIAEHCQLQT
ncbi:MAG: hydrogenase maturation protease [Pirellulaceae bacterium]|nr:hydrogenase maturation protease [Pirellulaceae bacterium]